MVILKSREGQLKYTCCSYYQSACHSARKK